jgi:hypothetical protein
LAELFWSTPYAAAREVLYLAVQRGAQAGGFDPLGGTAYLEWPGHDDAGRSRSNRYRSLEDARADLLRAGDPPTHVYLTAFDDVEERALLAIRLFEGTVSVTASGSRVDGVHRAFDVARATIERSALGPGARVLRLMNEHQGAFAVALGLLAIVVSVLVAVLAG